MTCLSRLTARAFLRLLRAAGLGLVVFHAWLLASIVADGQIADPMVAVRWLMAFGLAGGLIALRRAGVPLFASRRGAALWVIVVLLHASASGTAPARPAAEAASGSAILFVLPMSSAGVMAVATCLVVRARRLATTTLGAAPLNRLWRVVTRPDVAPFTPSGPLRLLRGPPEFVASFC